MQLSRKWQTWHTLLTQGREHHAIRLAAHAPPTAQHPDLWLRDFRLDPEGVVELQTYVFTASDDHFDLEAETEVIGKRLGGVRFGPDGNEAGCDVVSGDHTWGLRYKWFGWKSYQAIIMKIIAEDSTFSTHILLAQGHVSYTDSLERDSIKSRAI